MDEVQHVGTCPSWLGWIISGRWFGALEIPCKTVNQSTSPVQPFNQPDQIGLAGLVKEEFSSKLLFIPKIHGYPLFHSWWPELLLRTILKWICSVAIWLRPPFPAFCWQWFSFYDHLLHLTHHLEQLCRTTWGHWLPMNFHCSGRWGLSNVAGLRGRKGSSGWRRVRVN